MSTTPNLPAIAAPDRKAELAALEARRGQPRPRRRAVPGPGPV